MYKLNVPKSMFCRISFISQTLLGREKSRFLNVQVFTGYVMDTIRSPNIKIKKPTNKLPSNDNNIYSASTVSHATLFQSTHHAILSGNITVSFVYNE